MLADEKPVAWNQRCGFKAKPTVPLYTRPAPAAPQAEPETFESELRSFAETPEQVAFVEKLIAPQAEQKRPQTCLWSRADDDTDMWETTCGNAFTIIDGSPADNQMAFCCYCGRELESETGDSDADK